MIARLSGAIRAWKGRGGHTVMMAQVVLLRSLAQAVNVCTGLLSAALLGPSGRGTLAAIITGPGFLAGIASLGLHASLIYHVKARPEEERAYVGNGMILTLLAGGIAAAIGWVLMPRWLAHYPPHAIAIGRLLLITTPMTVVTWTMSGAAEARGWFGFANRTLYLQGLLILAGLLGLWATANLTPESAAFAYTAPAVPVFAYFAVFTVLRVRPRFTPRPKLMAQLLHYGVRISGVDFVSTCANYADQVLVVAVLAPEMVGAYVVALSAARLLTVLQTGVAAVLFPSVAAREADHVVRLVAVSFHIVFVVTGTAAIGLALFGPKLLLLIYGARFAPAIAPFRLLLAATLIGNGAAVLSQAYAARGRPGLVTITEAVGLLLSVAMMLVLVPHFATVGAAISVLASAIFRLAAYAMGMKMFVGGGMPRLVPSLTDIHRLLDGALRRPAPALAIEPVSLEPLS